MVKRNCKDILLIISLSIAFIDEIGSIDIPDNFCFSIMIVWIGIAMLYIITNFGKGNSVAGITTRLFLRYNFGIKVVIYLYTVFLVAFGITESRFLSTNIQTFVNGLSAVSIFYIFKKKAFTNSLIALSIAYVIKVIASVFMGTSFEFHDIAFATGFIIIYFFTRRSLRIKDVKWVLLAILIFFVTFKRIGIGALLVTMLAYLIYAHIPSNLKKIYLFVVPIAFIGVIYFYIWSIYSGWLITITEQIGINWMGRQYYYQIPAWISEFQLSFLGLGRNAVATLMTSDYSYMRVDNIHSDIIRMYIECGFWLFAVWLWVYIWKIPSVIGKLFGKKERAFFLLCTIYIFTIYFTDNVELYLVTQYFYILVPLHFIYENNYNRELSLQEYHHKINKKIRFKISALQKM